MVIREDPSVPTTCRSHAQEAARLIAVLDNNPSFIGFHHPIEKPWRLRMSVEFSLRRQITEKSP